MAGTPWSATENKTRTQVHGSQTETKAYYGQVFPHLFNLDVLEEDNLRIVGAHPYSLSHPTPRLDDAYMYDYFPPSHPLSVSYPNEPNAHPSSSFLPAGSQLPNDRPSCVGPSFPQPPELYDLWGSSHPSPGLSLNATCDVSIPVFHQPMLDPTVYSDSPRIQSPRFISEVQIRRVDEIFSPPTIDDHPTFPLPASASFPHPNLDDTAEPTSDAWYPCLWTNRGAVCNVMVLASRSHMNRHLHACHGFGGTDAQTTRCRWAGCGARMQQGSIARHTVTCHLQAKVTCPLCSKKLSRQDVISKHQRVCPAAGTWR